MLFKICCQVILREFHSEMAKVSRIAGIEIQGMQFCVLKEWFLAKTIVKWNLKGSFWMHRMSLR